MHILCLLVHHCNRLSKYAHLGDFYDSGKCLILVYPMHLKATQREDTHYYGICFDH